MPNLEGWWRWWRRFIGRGAALAPLHLELVSGLSWHLGSQQTTLRLTWGVLFLFVFYPDVFLDGCAPSKSKVDPCFTITLFFLFANLHLTDTSFATSNILGSSDLVILVGIGMRGIDLALASRRSSWSWARNVGIHKVGQQTHRKQWWEILKFVVTPLPTRKKKVSCFIRIWISSLLYVTIFF